MRNVIEKILVASVLVVLIFVFIILRIILGFSFPFFLVGSIVASLIFVILLWVLVRHHLDPSTIAAIVGCIGLSTITLAIALGLISLVVLLSLRLRSPIALYLSCAADSILVVVICSSILVRKIIDRSRRNNAKRLISDEEMQPELELSYLGHVGALPKRFRYEELRAATNNFQNPIGRGGSGSVFKGFLGDGFPVAVKRIEGELHGDREFRTEITTILSVQHVNLARILGYCHVSGGYRYLVYEFVENGSLDCWIFAGKGAKEIWLTWALRYQVAIDVAKALAYLHNDCRSRILHLDVKPQNILLDANFRACVSDFGISRMMEKDESRVITTVRGTRGYLAPEWFSGGGISEKSDVYSYGIVLLELVGGRRNWDFIDNGAISQRTWFYLPKIASEKMREGKLMEVVDERLMRDGQPDEAEVRLLVYVALWCIQEKAELRPSMELVVSMLRGHVSVTMPPETKMFLVDHFDMPVVTEISSDSSRTQNSSSAGQTERPLLSTRSFTRSFTISTQFNR